jgi:DNA-binding transcriptional regulator YiaG
MALSRDGWWLRKKGRPYIDMIEDEFESDEAKASKQSRQSTKSPSRRRVWFSTMSLPSTASILTAVQERPASSRRGRRRGMKKMNTIAAKRRSDGTLVQVLPDGSKRILKDKTVWQRLRTMTVDEITAAALADPDARPATVEQLRQARRVPRTRTLRRALHLTQEEFAARYIAGLGTGAVRARSAGAGLSHRDRSRS